VLTGLLYVNPESRAFHEALNLTETPLAWLPESQLRPGADKLREAMAELD